MELDEQATTVPAAENSESALNETAHNETALSDAHGDTHSAGEQEEASTPRTSAQPISQDDLERLISEYEVKVFSLAMHITNDLNAAAQVVEDVFLRLSRERHEHPELEVDTLIHRFTYDSAISLLLTAKRRTAE